MTPNNLHIYTDGGARHNPGPAAIGVVIKDQHKKTIHQFSRTIGTATNNQAEYQAVIDALTWLIDNKTRYPQPSICNFFLDSKLIVNQLNGLWKIKDSSLRQKFLLARQLEAKLKSSIKYHLIPREQNIEPDSLLNQALDKLLH